MEFPTKKIHSKKTLYPSYLMLILLSFQKKAHYWLLVELKTDPVFQKSLILHIQKT